MIKCEYCDLEQFVSQGNRIECEGSFSLPKVEDKDGVEGRCRYIDRCPINLTIGRHCDCNIKDVDPGEEFVEQAREDGKFNESPRRASRGARGNFSAQEKKLHRSTDSDTSRPSPFTLYAPLNQPGCDNEQKKTRSRRQGGR